MQPKCSKCDRRAHAVIEVGPEAGNLVCREHLSEWVNKVTEDGYRPIVIPPKKETV